MHFLGLEIDTLHETVRLPKEKLDKAISEIKTMLTLKKCTLRQMQSLLGLLQFTCKVIVPGRAFLQQLYRLTAGCSKPFHRIRLTHSARKDLSIWLYFLENHNGVTLYKEEMFLSHQVIKFQSDASKHIGCAAIWGDHWFYVKWPSTWWHDQNITFLEFVPIIMALEAWGPQLRNKCIEFHTDNKALSYVINKQSSKEDLVHTYVRKLVLSALSYNILVKAVYIPGEYNILSDSLSRLQIARFLSLHPTADKFPTKVPPLPLKLV